MKKILLLFTISIATFCTALCADGSSQSKIIANSKGVGPVKLNLPVAKLPASFGTLYDTFTSEVIEDYEGEYTVLHFKKSGSLVMTAYINYDDAIGSIEVFGSNVESAKGISPGDMVQKLFNKGAVVTMNNMGQIYFELDGLRYNSSGLKQSGLKKRDTAYSTGKDPQIKANDFEPNAKVESFVIFD